MKKPSLKDKLLEYVRSKNDWVNGGELERYAMELGKKGSTASRELRTLSEAENSPLLKEERMGQKVKSIWYKPRKEPLIVHYYVQGQVVATKKIWG